MFFRKTENHTESNKALEEATQHIEEVKSRGAEVTEVAEALREVRRKNHFAEQISLIMGKQV